MGKRALGGLVVWLVAAPLSHASEERPNVLLLLSDQHRWHAMGHTAMPELRTPTLDGLAEEGVSLTRALSNYPVCAPMRAILLTGRWPHANGVLDNPDDLDPETPTIGDAFQAAGYDTGYIGKWHLGDAHGSAFGFADSTVWTNTADHWDSQYQREDMERPRVYSEYNATGMADQAIAFLERERTAPFFLLVSFDPPHPSLDDPPRAMRGLYPPGTLTYRETVDASWREGRGFRRYQGYHAHVSALDRELGRVLAALEARGLAERTLVVYTSDHGTMLGAHGYRTEKRLPFDESVRVPFLVRWPGRVAAGARPAGLFSTIDIVPTLCALAGVAPPEGAAGVDRSALFTAADESAGAESVLLMHVRTEEKAGALPVPLYRGLRTARYTYAVGETGPWLLFDDEADPLQQRNLVDHPQHAALRERLGTELAAWLERAGDPFEVR